MPIDSQRILFEDEHLLAVDKRSGELVVRGKGEVGKLPLLDFLKKEYPGLRAVHRLDFETSGVVLFAKTKAAYDAVLKEKFAGWKKQYTTLVSGRLARQSGAITKPLPARERGTVRAETLYRVRERFANSTWVDVTITTGRHHQIRRHFALIGHALVLDDEYGNRKYNGTFKQEFGYRKFFLHAEKLSLPHPITGKQVEIQAPLPRNFLEVLKALQKTR